MMNKKLFLAVACLAIAQTAFPAAESAEQRYQRELNQAMQESAAIAQPARQVSVRETAQQQYDRELKQAMQESAAMAQPARPAGTAVIFIKNVARKDCGYMNPACTLEAIKNANLLFQQLSTTGKVDEHALKAARVPKAWETAINKMPGAGPYDYLQPTPEQIQYLPVKFHLLQNGNRFTFIDNMPDIYNSPYQGNQIINEVADFLRAPIEEIKRNANITYSFAINGPSHLFAIVVHKVNGKLNYYIADSDFDKLHDMHRQAIAVLRNLIEGTPKNIARIQF